MKLYHRTSIAEATDVVRNGFRDAKWQFDVRDRDGETLKKVGVWLTDRALGETEGPSSISRRTRLARSSSRGCSGTPACS
jgi:hypothetical protein